MNTTPVFGSSNDFLNSYLQKKSFSRIFILVDENTGRDCLPLVLPSVPSSSITIEIKSGEQNKNLETCALIWKELTVGAADRKSLLINLGGGVIGDMGGFCAATFKRGISFLNIPTTVLSQVDASVGGKLGIDFMGLKNHIGLFQEPEMVCVDSNFLKTLSERQKKSGFAEILKHCLIGNPKMWKDLSATHFEDLNWSDIIKESVTVKTDIVSRDFRESGERKLLNLGHTIGHGIETEFLNLNEDILHGEAVAAGIIIESIISKELGMLDSNTLEEVIKTIDRYFPRLPLGHLNRESIIGNISQDKKNQGQTINMVALTGIGKAKWDVRIDRKMIETGINAYEKGY